VTLIIRTKLEFKSSPYELYNDAPLQLDLLSEKVSRYISFYSPNDSDIQHYPSVHIERKEHYVTSYQSFSLIQLLYGDIETKLLRFLIDDYTSNESVLELKKLKLNDQESYYSIGRCIGNLPDSIFINASKNIPPKIKSVIDDITKFPQKKILIFSHFQGYNGSKLCSDFLSDSNIDHYQLTSKLSFNEIDKIINDFNSTNPDRKVLIIDKDSQVGLNLLAVERLHILEPPNDYADFSQLVARTRRLYSHNQLPVNRNKIVVVIHKCIIEPIANDKVGLIALIKNVIRSFHLNPFTNTIKMIHFKNEFAHYKKFYDNLIPYIFLSHDKGYINKYFTPDSYTDNTFQKCKDFQDNFSDSLKKYNISSDNYKINEDCVPSNIKTGGLSRKLFIKKNKFSKAKNISQKL
tara:strand:- start:1742 stop:2959 length:1218 start_codon:yes stop_codon:yes gene_type:complete